jgi:hypothetical protein
LYAEQWSEERRDAAAIAEKELVDQYIDGGWYAHAMDAIHNFMSISKDRNVDYVDAFLTGDTTAEEYTKVSLS